MEHKGFADHGELGGAEFVLAMMADEKMLNDDLQIRRKSFDGVHGLGNRFQFHNDVAEELAFDGVTDSAFIAKFVKLPDIMQNRGGQQQINVELGIMGSDLLCEAAQADDVFEQAAKISVVHDLRGGSALVTRGEAGIGNNSGHQLFEPGISDGSRVFQKLGVELVDVFPGVREKIGQVDLLRLCEADLLKRKLRPVAVNLDARLDFDEIVAADVFHRGVKLIPHACFDGAAAVAEFKAEISLAFTSVANLFFVNEKKRSDALLRIEIGDKGCLHDPDTGLFPNRRNFLWPFLCLLTSGVALTS